MTNEQIAAVFASSKPGSLHRALGVPKGQKIPVYKLRIAVKWTGRRAALAAKAAMVLNIRAARRRAQKEAR
jgi:hypothetical protein